jgi:hypothetical protein
MHSTTAETAKNDDVEVSQHDTPDAGLAYPVEKPQEMTAITSAFANLTRGQSIRKFWRLYATVLLTSIGAMYVLAQPLPTYDCQKDNY